MLLPGVVCAKKNYYGIYQYMPDSPSLLSRHPVDVVAIGASSGGLDAFRRLLSALPTPSGMAFILVQHLDPSNDSHLVELLAPHTGLVVTEAVDGMPVLADHLYVIAPDTSLMLAGGILRVTSPSEVPGQRMPLDVLMSAMAMGLGQRAMAVVLSGSGSDGTKGALAIRARGGLVLVQDPAEAASKEMPQGVVAAGAASAVLPLAEIPAALVKHSTNRLDPDGEHLARIAALLKERTGGSFGLYKPGTLWRRVERRMSLADIKDIDAYIALLEEDEQEVTLLGKDLLIHVTAFFRDPAVFAVLAEEVLPGLMASHPANVPLRLWVAACSTGEEAWSLAMLFQEAIAASGKPIKLQVFGSDLDAEAIATARRGFYTGSITQDVSPERLSRFFVPANGGWRVCQELRNCLIFSVQDVLADPPFSRLDFVSCRNLLIYLKPAAQARVISVFHFALRSRGLLLLGNAETLGQGDVGFEAVVKSQRLWRRSGKSRRIELGLLNVHGDATQAAPRRADLDAREERMGALCRRLVLETHAPAAVLLDRDDNCLYSLGPTEAYLVHPPGQPTQNILLMARPSIRAGLSLVVQQAREAGQPTSLTSTLMGENGNRLRLDARTVTTEPGNMLLICFVELAGTELSAARGGRRYGRIATLEQELEAARAELRGATQSLQRFGENQRSLDEEALSVNEEYQSTNEELLTSKEELQSMNEELTALNGQLQETLERTRTTSNDLQNVLFSTDVATLFLDTKLQIRFFTPATRALFSLLPGDVGRPLADLRALATDDDLLGDASAVLQGGHPPAREIRTAAGTWYLRTALPYSTQERKMDGVVITFADVTARKMGAEALQEARQVAEGASAAKSQFLSAASHDLRQPLQTLILLQSMLARSVQGEEATRLVQSLEPTLSAMAGILNTLLDVDQIGSGTLVPAHAHFRVAPLLEKLRREFSHLAATKGLELRVVPSSLAINTDPALLELMLRNLLDNALKYTTHGRILLGCRRRGGVVSIEVWDTGIGIAEKDLASIFDAYHQVRALPRDRQEGLGLGLSIVQRLSILLGHELSVRSRMDRGSVFSVAARVVGPPEVTVPEAPAVKPRGSSILVIENDPQLRGLLLRLLAAEGHGATGAGDARAGLVLVRETGIRPALLVADFNLPGGMTGLEAAMLLRAQAGGQLPVIILTGDMSKKTREEIARKDCVQLSKPVRPAELVEVARRLLAAAASTPLRLPGPGRDASFVHIIDDDPNFSAELRVMLEQVPLKVEEHASAEAFLVAHPLGGETGGCMLIDVKLPGMSGLDLLAMLRARGDAMPAIMMTGLTDVPEAVRSIKVGAVDYIKKPIEPAKLLELVAKALEQSREHGRQATQHRAALDVIGRLTPRQRVVLERVLAGEPSKNIAADLGVSQRTVEAHRAAIMRATGARSLPALARLAMAAAGGPKPDEAD